MALSEALLSLPVDGHVESLIEHVRRDRAVVVVAEPGAGKTTRVPRALLLSGLFTSGEIWVLQPRRIACRMSAQRVATELGEPVGQRVGYQVRFDEKTSSRTRVRFVTEGIVARRLLSDPQLKGVAAIVLDEFHERSLHADFVLACVARLRAGVRSDLAVIVMSATLDAGPVADFLMCAVLHVPGRTFPVAVSYQFSPGRPPLERQVLSAVTSLLDAGEVGDVLVFLPGASEIRRAFESCRSLCERAGRDLVMLHGDLSAAEQDRAVTAGARPRVICSTNLAETSLTLPSVTAVVDSGLCRVAGHNAYSGLATLAVRPVSQASAIQRMGRAGRVAEGRCVRLYSEHDFSSRPRHDTPELLRADLAELLLSVAALPFELTTNDWLVPPPAPAMQQARRLLVALQAVTDADRLELTALGRRMLAWPLHPRLARLVAECDRRGIGQVGATVAAMLADRDLLLVARARLGSGQAMVDACGPSDVLHRLECLQRLEKAQLDARVARREQIDLSVARRIVKTREQLARRLNRRGHRGLSEEDEESLGMAIVAAFPDRVAKRRRPGEPEVVFGQGGSARIAESSVVRDQEFVVVVDAAEVSGRQRFVQARLVSAIEPEWLLELFPDAVEDRTQVVFEETTGRAQALHRLCYQGLVLDESRGEADGEQLAATLFSAAQDKGFSVFDLNELQSFQMRLAFARARGALPEGTALSLADVARAACQGAATLEDLRRRRLIDYLPAVCPPAIVAAVDRHAPTHVKLSSGRTLQINYEPDRPPWVASRLQDFFGMQRGPTVGGDPLVLHLLAPNRRAVQVTQDLAGFWSRHYPELRKPLMRRYPKHFFPDDPLSAQPPAPRSPRSPAGRSRR